jgi:hypothetical protein
MYVYLSRPAEVDGSERNSIVSVLVSRKCAVRSRYVPITSFYTVKQPNDFRFPFSFFFSYISRDIWNFSRYFKVCAYLLHDFSRNPDWEKQW